jgi:hypothetical protein
MHAAEQIRTMMSTRLISVHEAAGLARDATYLLRPDTYVALADASGAPEALERYFSDQEIRMLSASR